MPNVEYVITKSGVKKRIIEEMDVQATDGIITSLSGNVMRKCARVLTLGGNYGGVGFAASQNNHTTWSIRVLQLPLNCPWNTESGTVVPVFDSESLPVMRLMWKVPDSMILLLIAQVSQGSKYKVVEQSLVAMDSSSHLYMLPVSNLYDDLRLCSGLTPTGMMPLSHPAAVDAVREVAAQFDKSHWNQDLYATTSSTRKQHTKNLFRFKPLNEGFEQLPSTDEWQKLCVKVSNPELFNQIIPVSL